jgi:hypothetical protein
MIEAMEVLLCAWGQEVLNPAIDVSISSPLGRTDEESGGAGGGRCLSTVEFWVEMSRAAQAVDAALAGLADDVAPGLGALGRTMVQLALVRYCTVPRATVANQSRRLGISVRTYRTRVDELHAQLLAVLPGVAEQLDRTERGLAANMAKVERARAARKASRTEQLRLDRRLVARKARAGAA